MGGIECLRSELDSGGYRKPAFLPHMYIRRVQRLVKSYGSRETFYSEGSNVRKVWCMVGNGQTRLDTYALMFCVATFFPPSSKKISAVSLIQSYLLELSPNPSSESIQISHLRLLLSLPLLWYYTSSSQSSPYCERGTVDLYTQRGSSRIPGNTDETFDLR